jgi:hypothetical protein
MLLKVVQRSGPPSRIVMPFANLRIQRARMFACRPQKQVVSSEYSSSSWGPQRIRQEKSPSQLGRRCRHHLGPEPYCSHTLRRPGFEVGLEPDSTIYALNASNVDMCLWVFPAISWTAAVRVSYDRSYRIQQVGLSLSALIRVANTRDAALKQNTIQAVSDTITSLC